MATERNYELALALCLFVKDKALQSAIAAQMVGLTAAAMRESGDRSQAIQMEKTIHETLCFPRSIFLKHMACANYAQGNYNAALGLYLKLGDAEAALQTFCEHLCPLYFGSPALISKLQIQRVQRDTMRASREASLRKAEGPPRGYKYSG